MLNCYLKTGALAIMLFCVGTLNGIAQVNQVSASASEGRLSGIVLDEYGKALSGAVIKIEDSKEYTFEKNRQDQYHVKTIIHEGQQLGVSDETGSFNIPVGNKEANILVTFPGYLTQILKLSDQGKMIIKMEPAYLKNPEKVTILYDEKDSKEILGSVASIYNRQLKTTPTSLYLNALSGRLPGFQTIEYSGFGTGRTTPITKIEFGISFPNDATEHSSGHSDNSEVLFNLRGQKPVTMIDGVQRDIYSIDPENIESVTVLKDALSTILLGQKSSRGVLQILTKKGISGPPRISFTAQTGVQNSLNQPKPLEAYQYAYLYNEGLTNAGQSAAYSSGDFSKFREGSSPFRFPNVNWYNTILRDDAPLSKYNLNINGGLKNARYSISVSYFNQQGMFKTSDDFDYSTKLELNRYLINSSIDVDVTKDFNIGLQIFGRIQDGRQPGAGVPSLLSKLYSTPNNAYPVYNPDQSYGGNSVNTTNLYGMTAGSGYLIDNSRDLMANLDLKYKFDNWLPGLYVKAKVNVSTTSSSLVNRSRQDPTYEFGISNDGDTVYTRYGTISNQQNSLNMTSVVQTFYAQAAIGYDSKIGKNNFGGMLFVDRQTVNYQFDLPGTYTDLAANGNYNYDQKYFVEGAVNYAGYDRFKPGDQFGLFYAGGVGWDIARENFMKNGSSRINQLKLRATYGRTGNSNEDRLGYFSWRSAFGQDGVNSYYVGGNYSAQFGLRVERGLANVKATWEKGNKFNTGLDVVFLENRFKASFDYYRDIYFDLLQARGASIALIGMNYPNENIGKNLYEGQELSLSYQNNIRKFHYFITANVSRMRTEVLYMDEVAQKYDWNKRTGRPVGQPFGYAANGLIQNQEEADRSATFAGGTIYPGDIRLIDLNNDGVIDQFDQKPIGNRSPVIYYGTTLGFSVAGFDFSVLLQGVKNRIYQSIDYSFGAFGKEQGYDYLVGRWTPETAGTATYPRLTVGFNNHNYANSSYWLHSGEYFRVKNIDVGYTFPYKLTHKLKVSVLRVFANAQNLFTETSYTRLDPEFMGNSYYPLQRIINTGVNIKF